MMDENNNDLAIELPTLKSEQTELATNYQNTNMENSSPLLTEKVEEPIVTSEVSTPIAAEEVKTNPIEMPSAPAVEVPVTPVMPQTPVVPVVETPVEPVNNAPEQVQTQPEVTSTPVQEIPSASATPATPVVPVTAVPTSTPAATEEKKEPEIKKASKTSQLIGTIVLLVITALIVIWLAKRYFVL